MFLFRKFHARFGNIIPVVSDWSQNTQWLILNDPYFTIADISTLYLRIDIDRPILFIKKQCMQYSDFN